MIEVMIEVIILIGLTTAVLVDSFIIGFVIRFSPKFEGFKKNEKILLQVKHTTGFKVKKMFWPIKEVTTEYYTGPGTTVILTDKRVVFRPQLLTCALDLDYDDILKVTEEKYLFNQYICLHYIEKNKEKKFYFHPKTKYEKWLNILKEYTLGGSGSQYP